MVTLNAADAKKRIRWTRKKTLIVFAASFCLLTPLLLFLVVLFANPSLRGPELPENTTGLQVFDRKNELVAIMFEDRDIYPLSLDKIGKHLTNALITAEDRNFYEHHGINISSIARALLANLHAGHNVQGGSTLTQQLVKNLYFIKEKRTFWTKIKEAVLSIELECKYSKQQILEAYLNYVYFGKGNYGVERAAQKYFGKSTARLSLAESAYLAGLVNAPSELSSKEGHAAAIERQQEILSNMEKLNYATAAEVKKAKAQNLVFRERPTARESASYFIAYAIQLLKTRYTDHQLWHEGLHLYTTLDQSAQQSADAALSSGIRRAPKGVSQGALVCIAVPTDEVLAMVGGAGNYSESPWNRAINPHTAGSAFKPFVYLAGLRNSILHPNTMIDDLPLTISNGFSEAYSPKNFDGKFMGPLPVRKALALSRNICAVRIAQMVGIQTVIYTAQDAGIRSKLDNNLALALGCSAVTPLELANAYGTLARQGIFMEPYMIRQVTYKDGRVLEAHQVSMKKAFELEPIFELTDMMQDVVKFGTGKAASLGGRPVAGKTGTADGARDVWFVGFTPDVVTAVWGGNDSDKPIPGNGVSGGSVAAGIWRNYMQNYYQLHPTPFSQFPRPQTPFMDESDIALAAQQAQLAAQAARGMQPQLGLNAAQMMPPLAPNVTNQAGGFPAPMNSQGGLRGFHEPLSTTNDADELEREKQHKKEKKTGKIGRFFRKFVDAFN
jgi:penicillin-binding protein 1A